MSTAKSITKAGEGRFVHNHIRCNKGSHLDSFNKPVEGMNALHGRGVTKKSATGTTIRNKMAWTMRASWKSVSALAKDMKEAEA